MKVGETERNSDERGNKEGKEKGKTEMFKAITRQPIKEWRRRESKGSGSSRATDDYHTDKPRM